MPLAANGDEAALEEPGLVRVPTSGSWVCSAEAGTISRVGPGSELWSGVADPGAAALTAPSKEARGAEGPAAVPDAAVAAGSRAGAGGGGGGRGGGGGGARPGGRPAPQPRPDGQAVSSAPGVRARPRRRQDDGD